LLLTRQEVSQKRKKLEGLRLDLAKRIGAFVKDADAAVSRLKENREEPDISLLGEVIGERITFLEQSLADPLPLGQEMPHYQACDLRSPIELLTSVQITLHKSAKRNAATFKRQLAPLRRPLWITRSWPWLVVTPLVGYYGAKILYNSRQSLYEYYQLAVDTVRGFVVDWVIDPCIKILETLRHGDSSLALMGRESLKSDFDVSTSTSETSSNMTSQKVFIEAMRANLR
jgi:nuclear-control-of-ATPase protein 2